MPGRLVHVVDDDEAMRESLTFLLWTAGFEVIAYESGTELLERLKRSASGCILTDIRMPGLDGLDLLRNLRATGHKLPIVMMTGHGEVPVAVEAMKLGACDFLEKPFDDTSLLHTLSSALDRDGLVPASDPSLLDFVRRVGTLTERERQVLDALVAGGTSKEIARLLDISPRTVEIYRAKLMSKTRAGNLQELVRWSVLAGIA
ncbi:response regulator FixJ [Methylobacterium sp. J-067]|uniref:response regulator FixJ n=1 Tax=Methylobacterium sp. J-067 TaxID=2836648 RepID=UPI001FBBB7AF|nr:response regulator FixJ [Methylobacterium sp. J-067]MCJ2025959.1 response regulator [Methylobacterium sp. J-067]